jgi:hypothetical protein
MAGLKRAGIEPPPRLPRPVAAASVASDVLPHNIIAGIDHQGIPELVQINDGLVLDVGDREAIHARCPGSGITQTRGQDVHEPVGMGGAFLSWESKSTVSSGTDRCDGRPARTQAKCRFGWTSVMAPREFRHWWLGRRIPGTRQREQGWRLLMRLLMRRGS